MLTPVDLQNKVFKGGIGFDKKDVETFMNEITSDYSMLYRSNVELNDKVNTLSESLQHYKSIEDSMQKALTISEKTSEETINAANDKARQITTEAELKAEALLADSKKELEDIKNEIYRLKQQEQIFKNQFGKILRAELRLLDGEVIDIDLGDGFDSSSSYGLGGEGVLGSEGGLGGGYTGSSPSNFEKTAQSPMFDRGSNLGMDPFASAANGGRFSKQTGGDYTGAKKNKKSGKSGTTLNIKSSKSNTVHRASVAAMTGNPQKYYDSKNSLNNSNNETVNEVDAKEVKETINPSVNNAVNTDSINSNTSNLNNFVNEQSTDNISFRDNMNVDLNKDTPFNQQSKENLNEETVSSESTITPDNISEESTLSGEVENKVNESTMLDSEDNYSEGFDFVAGNEDDEDDIPTIIAAEVEKLKATIDAMQNDKDREKQAAASADDFDDNNNSDNDVFVGDVESKSKFDESRMIGNDDDDNDTFNFM